MEPLGHGAIRFRHLGDLREHGAFPCRSVLVRTLFSLQLFGAFLHRGSFLLRESLGLLRGLLCAHRFLLCRLYHVLLIWVCAPSLKDTRGRRLLYALLRCSAPFLCSRDAIEGHGFR